jgi:bifunctional non-homologous end joining protein LigD
MPKRNFFDRYETYDPAKEGYGNPEQWRQAFKGVLGGGSITTVESARQILGVSATETNPKTIQKAYWSKAKLHNAQLGGEHSAFDKITDAYNVLKRHVNNDTLIIYPTIVPTQAFSIILPQLLNEIEESELERYFTDPNYCAQEKHDGRRRMLKFQNGITKGYNKKGQFSDCIESFNRDCKIIADNVHKSEFLLDGEEVGDIYNPFDILSCDGDWRTKSYNDRWKNNNFLFRTQNIKPVYTAYTEKEKRELFQYLQENKKEGIVFKLLNGIHIPGYSDEQVKFKFWATASVIILKHNIQDSIGVGVIENGNVVPIGNVTMIGHTKPPIGSIVEVKYLYIIKGGRLYQPSFLGPRDDQYASDCIIEKLKFKS